MFDSIMRDLKDKLKKAPHQIRQSSKDPSRYIVIGPQGMKFILQRTKYKHDGKEIFVPITVLSPYMKCD
jgi:hypothetical protein